MTDRVYIFDTTLRDGEQSPGCSMTVPEKLSMARKLVELGVDILEAGFPIASEGDFQAVDAVSREFPWAQVAALARCCTGDVERAAKSLTHAKRPRIHTFIATSDIHLKFKLKKTQQQVLDDAVAAVELARRYVDDVEFSAEDGARTHPDFLEKISKAVVAAGARTVNIPDTVGYSTPKEYGALIGRIANALGDCAIVSVHCHDDLGLAVANSLAAVEAGARQIECTINGIGERAGNCSLEEIVMILKTRADSYPYHTGIHAEHLFSASELLTSIIDEVRFRFHYPSVASVPAFERELELAWGMHSTMVFAGIRRYVYHTPVSTDVETTVRDQMHAYLMVAPMVLEELMPRAAELRSKVRLTSAV